MQIKVGDRIPDVDLMEGSPDKIVNLRKLAANKKLVVVTVNGAFMGCCGKGHLQGYIDNYEKFKEKGIDEMVVISGNDPYVMQAWADQLNVAGKFRFLADTHGKFCKMSGLVLDEREKFGTLRCKRSCMYVDDALVERLCIEPDGKSVTCSKAEACLEKCC